MRAKLDLERINYLDGLRGVAILLVIAFHSYYRWPQYVPYGSSYSECWVIRFGYLGVQLFFIISGFVILMTLEKKPTFGMFIRDRWLRLFPGMLICTMIIIGATILLSPLPMGNPNFIDIFPGLTFLNPRILTAIFATDFKSLDGAFWSLYVEVEFYILFGGAYFAWGRCAALVSLLMVQCSYYIILLISKDFVSVKPFLNAMEVLGARNFGWFLCGSLIYLYSTSKSNRYAVYAFGSIVLTLIQYMENFSELIAASIISSLFILPVIFGIGRDLLSSTPLIITGIASYPLYLMHQNITIGFVSMIGRIAPSFPSPVLPLIATAILMLISLAIARSLEPKLKSFIVNTVNSVKFRYD